jgi:hypothetical protein
MSVTINDRPVTIADVQRGVQALLKNSITTGNDGVAGEEHNSQVTDRQNGVDLVLTTPATQQPTYQPDKKLLGKEVAAAVQLFPKAIIERLEREVKQKHIKPQKIIEFKVDLDRHVEVNTGELRLTLLGDYKDTKDDELKIREEHLERIRDNKRMIL